MPRSKQAIFAKQATVDPNRLYAVAERRFRDAEVLCATGHADRSSGAQYLAGFVIEILLKRQLVNQYKRIRNLSAGSTLSGSERRHWELVWRSHDLELLLNALPNLKATLIDKGRRSGATYYEDLLTVCSTWTVFARYSSNTSTIWQAEQLLERVRRLKEVLK